jgi:NADH-quinone oxidoreductase subunit C
MNYLNEHYDVIEKNPRLFAIHLEKPSLGEAIHAVTTHTEFVTLSQIACADWIEEEHFELTYLFTDNARSKNLMLKVKLGRDGQSLPSLASRFPQAEVMERDLHEMYGIGFEGNTTLYDFVLEGWKDIPPMRREFDTLAYVHEHYDFQRGRADNKDVKVEQKRRREEAKRLKADADTQAGQEPRPPEGAPDGK